MEKTKEEFEEKVGEALAQPRSKFPLVVDIGRLSGSQSQATKVCEIFGLKKSDLVRARWVAVDKSRVLKENPKADYSQVLEEIKDKESIMVEESIKQRVEERKKEVINKKIIEKARTVTNDLGRASIWWGIHVFKVSNLKLETEKGFTRGQIRVWIYEKQKFFKRLVFMGTKTDFDEEITVYKPGEWVKILSLLHEIASIKIDTKEKKKRQKRKAQKRKIRGQKEEQRLIRDFDL